jgi:hypothetical protein
MFFAPFDSVPGSQFSRKFQLGPTAFPDSWALIRTADINKPGSTTGPTGQVGRRRVSRRRSGAQRRIRGAAANNPSLGAHTINRLRIFHVNLLRYSRAGN